jgi:hypothetical protein
VLVLNYSDGGAECWYWSAVADAGVRYGIERVLKRGVSRNWGAWSARVLRVLRV